MRRARLERGRETHNKSNVTREQKNKTKCRAARWRAYESIATAATGERGKTLKTGEEQEEQQW